MKFASCSSCWISPRLLALVANYDKARNTYLHRRNTSERSSQHAKAHAVCLLCRRMPISFKTRDPKMAGRLHRLMVSPGYTRCNDDSFLPNKKRQVRILKLNWLCILVKLLKHYTSGHKRKGLAMGKTKWLGTFNQLLLHSYIFYVFFIINWDTLFLFFILL